LTDGWLHSLGAALRLIEAANSAPDWLAPAVRASLPFARAFEQPKKSGPPPEFVYPH